jgi:hypothetical protein
MKEKRKERSKRRCREGRGREEREGKRLCEGFEETWPESCGPGVQHVPGH